MTRVAKHLIADAKAEKNNRNVCLTCDIREMAVCSALRPEELLRLNKIATARVLEPEETVFYEGDEADTLYNVTTGCVRMTKMLADGRRQVTGFLYPGDFLGLAFYDKYAYSAEAVGIARLCRFSHDKFQALLRDCPELEHRVLGQVSNELAAAQDQILLLGRKSAREKLASFLIHLSERAELRGNDSCMLDLPMQRRDIADYIGVSVETVSRLFTSFKNDGVIGVPDAKHVVLLQTNVLEDLAGL